MGRTPAEILADIERTRQQFEAELSAIETERKALVRTELSAAEQEQIRLIRAKLGLPNA